uniref:Uncharacterized protein n=1 Tax=Romanomermis culicivorax TaxID=13658 RepID=A0A915KZE9_ROMCU
MDGFMIHFLYISHNNFSIGLLAVVLSKKIDSILDEFINFSETIKSEELESRRRAQKSPTPLPLALPPLFDDDGLCFKVAVSSLMEWRSIESGPRPLGAEFPPNAPFEKSRAAITSQNAVMFARRNVVAYDASQSRGRRARSFLAPLLLTSILDAIGRSGRMSGVQRRKDRAINRNEHAFLHG